MYRHLPYYAFHPYGYSIRGGGRGRGRGRGRGGRGVKRGRGTSRNSEPSDMRRGHDSVTQRVLSASRNKVNELRNKVEELKIEIRDLQMENKLYKKMQFRQEKALKTFEDKENDLPNILDKHNNEIRSLKEQNRRLKEKYDKTDRYLRDAEDELERMKKRLKKYKEVAEEKELLERDELSKKLTQAELDMEERDVKIKELQRHLETLKKNHRHELGIEVARQREMKKQMEELEEQNSKMGVQLKEKDKALEYKNIYSKTISDNAEGLSSTRKPPKKASSMTDLTPRDKAKFYAEKKREELKKQKQIREQQEKKKRQKWEKEEMERVMDDPQIEEPPMGERDLYTASSSPPHPTSTPPPFSFNSIDRGLEEREREEERRREEEQRKWRERERAQEVQKEEIERQKRELEKRKSENLRREAEDRQTKEKEERRRKEVEKEERERRDREERERKERLEGEERERKERLEFERREKEREEQERRLRMEREKAENDPKIQEERKKKDELLKKLQAMDELGSAGTAKRDPFNMSPPHKNGKEHSIGGSSGDGYSTPSRRSERKEYSFTRPIENLHKGKPSHEDAAQPVRASRRRQSKDDDDIGGYQPSFGPSKVGAGKNPISSSKPISIFDDDEPAFKPAGNVSTVNAKTKDKKSANLLENLFGPQAASTTKDNSFSKRSEENETFFVTSKSPDVGSKKNNTDSVTVFPWDSPATNGKTNGMKTSFNMGGRSGSSTIYGGGAALLDDDDFSSNRNKVLPRRQKQANVNTFSAKPTVSAVDAFDDDFEEVVL